MWYTVAVAKIRISPEFRLLLSDKLMDLGNLTAGVLVLGQFVSDKDFSINFLIVGFALMITCYIVGFIINR